MSVRLVRTIFILMLLVVVGALSPHALASPLADAPINDNFLNAQFLDGPMGTVNVSNVEATKEDWEPSHAGGAGGASIWFVWTAPLDSSMTFDTQGSDFDTLLAVYTWPNFSGPLNEVSGNDDASPDVTTSSVTFNALTGETYYIAVDGFKGLSGNVVLNWVSASPVVFQPPISPTPDTTPSPTLPTSCPPPQIASFTINRPEINLGETAILNWGAVTNATSAVIDNGIGGVPTPGSRQIRPDKNTTYTLTANGCGGTITTQVTVNVNALDPPSNNIPKGRDTQSNPYKLGWDQRSNFLYGIDIETDRSGSFKPLETKENLNDNRYDVRNLPGGKYRLRFRTWLIDRNTKQRVSLKSAWSVICFNFRDNEACR